MVVFKLPTKFKIIMNLTKTLINIAFGSLALVPFTAAHATNIYEPLHETTAPSHGQVSLAIAESACDNMANGFSFVDSMWAGFDYAAQYVDMRNFDTDLMSDMMLHLCPEQIMKRSAELEKVQQGIVVPTWADE